MMLSKYDKEFFKKVFLDLLVFKAFLFNTVATVILPDYSETKKTNSQVISNQQSSLQEYFAEIVDYSIRYLLKTILNKKSASNHYHDILVSIFSNKLPQGIVQKI